MLVIGPKGLWCSVVVCPLLSPTVSVSVASSHLSSALGSEGVDSKPYDAGL